MQVEIGGAHIGLPADLTLETLGLSERGLALVNHQDVISEWDGHIITDQIGHNEFFYCTCIG